MPAKVREMKYCMSEVTCTVCKDVVPVGYPYRYYKPGFMGRLKIKRCMKPECYPKRSELAMNKIGRIYAEIEGAEASLEGADSPEAVGELLVAVANECDSVREDYEEARENMPVDSGDWIGWIEVLDGYASDLRGFDTSPDRDLDEAKEAAQTLLDEFEL